jgi:hypothetical protein
MFLTYTLRLLDVDFYIMYKRTSVLCHSINVSFKFCLEMPKRRNVFRNQVQLERLLFDLIRVIDTSSNN